MAKRQVYGIINLPPEIAAYATVRYSRSSDSMRQSIDWIYGRSAAAAAGRAENFFDTYYFQYGHGSIADCGHVHLAIEQWSQLMAEEVEDEPLWDGQEQSTRYQDFSRRRFWKPRGWRDPGLLQLYVEIIHGLFGAYHHLSRRMFEVLSQRHPRPGDMKPDAYERTIRARAFDIARYLLPMATLTNVGQIVSIRTLEKQIRRLLASRYPEIRLLGEQIAAACRAPAYDVASVRLRAALGVKMQTLSRVARGEYGMPMQDYGPAIRVLEEIAQELLPAVLPDTPVAPTLVRYLEPDGYLERTRARLRAMVERRQLEQRLRVRLAPRADRGRVDLVAPPPASAYVYEVVATALYWVTEYPFAELLDLVLKDLTYEEVRETWDALFAERGKHDELLRLFRGGYPLIVDTCVDIGADRDLKRHRRCVQIRQDLSPVHGYEVPAILDDPELAENRQRFLEAVESAHAACRRISQVYPHDALYVLPLATRRRRLYKMDPAEAVYIAELRAGVGGHFSYRAAAWDLYQQLVERYPEFREFVDARVTHPSVEAPLKR